MRLFRLTLATGLVLTMTSACATSGGDSSSGSSAANGESATAIDAVATSTAPATPTETPPGFYFNGEFIALGEFDPDSPVELINMCDDLPDEVLHSAGMQRVEASEAMTSSTGIVCVFAPYDESTELGTFGYMSDNVPKAMFKEQGLLLDDQPESTIPGLYTFTSRADVEGEDCHASITTERGRFSFEYHNYLEELPQSELCRKAITTVEQIYEQLRGKN